MAKSKVQVWLDSLDRRFDWSKGVPRKIKYPRKKEKKPCRSKSVSL
jgi:hypothetical protein